MKKLMVAMAAAAISVAGFAGTWFEAGFGSEAVSTGGSWSTNETGVSSAPTWEDTTLKLTDVEDPVIFAATDKKCTTGATVAFSTEVNFQGFDELPAIDDEAKAGICAINDGHFWVVGYDSEGATNKWVDTGLTATLNADVNVSVTVTNMTAYYQFGDSVPFSVDIKANTFSEVCYTGNGSVTQLGADFTDFYVDIVKPTIDGLVATCAVERAEIGSTVEIYFVDGTKISSDKGAYNYTVEANGSLTLLDGQRDLPTAQDPKATTGGVLYLTFSEALEAAEEGGTITILGNLEMDVDAIEKEIVIDVTNCALTARAALEIAANVKFVCSDPSRSGNFSLQGTTLTVDKDVTLDMSEFKFGWGGLMIGSGKFNLAEGSAVYFKSRDDVKKDSANYIFSYDYPTALVGGVIPAGAAITIGDNAYSGMPEPEAGEPRFVITSGDGEVAWGTVHTSSTNYVDSFGVLQTALDVADEVTFPYESEDALTFRTNNVVFAEENALTGTLTPPPGCTIEYSEGAYRVVPGEPPVETYTVTFSTNTVDVAEATMTGVESGYVLQSTDIPEFEGGSWDVDPVGAVITCNTNFNYTIEVPPAPTYTVTFSTNTVDVSEATLTGVVSGYVLTGDVIPEFEGGSWDVNPTNAVITCDTNFNYTIEAKVYPSDMPEGSKEAFDTWHAKYPTADRATSKEPFLLDCDPANIEEAKAAFKIISITKDGENWIVKVAGDKGEGDKYGNGYVHFVSVKSTKFPTAGANSDFFQAVLDYTPANPPE